MVGATVMVLTQIAMVAIMTMTPVHMRAHHHDLSAIGLVIGIHVGAMYLPSLVTGVLVDRVGRIPMAVAAAATLLLAGVTAAFAPPDSMPWLIVALALLGLGWNFGADRRDGARRRRDRPRQPRQDAGHDRRPHRARRGRRRSDVRDRHGRRRATPPCPWPAACSPSCSFPFFSGRRGLGL